MLEKQKYLEEKKRRNRNIKKKSNVDEIDIFFKKNNEMLEKQKYLNEN